MDKETYISLKAEDVHRRLITDIGFNMDEAPELLEELTAADRYKEDHVFRASIETAKVYLLSRAGKSSEVVRRCGHLIEIAGILQEWEILSFDYNMMANAYFLLGLYVKALQYYYSAINNEKEHNNYQSDDKHTILHSHYPSVYKSRTKCLFLGLCQIMAFVFSIR